jgi:hypothetical protein
MPNQVGTSQVIRFATFEVDRPAIPSVCDFAYGL